MDKIKGLIGHYTMPVYTKRKQQEGHILLLIR